MTLEESQRLRYSPIYQEINTMSDTSIWVTITLSDPQLQEEQLQETVQTLQSETLEVDGVTEADLVSIEEAPAGSKSIGGFLLDRFKALVDLNKLQNLVQVLSRRLVGQQTIEIEAKGNGRKLKVKIGSPEDLAKVMPEVEKFIKG